MGVLRERASSRPDPLSLGGVGRSSLGRRVGWNPAEPINGYRVITIDGDRVGSVASSGDGVIVVRTGSWPIRKARRLPVEFAVVRDIDRTVLMLTDPDQLQGSKTGAAGVGRARP